MRQRYDVAVIGGGILGLAHAWMAARHGLNVILIERSRVAAGATVRNFGMVWPVGQPAGELYQLALRSRDLWLELASAGVLEAERCTAIHLAHRRDELNVLEEFCEQRTHQVELLDSAQTIQLAPHANADGLLGGMLSNTELRVNPRVAAAAIARALGEKRVAFAGNIDLCFDTNVVNVTDEIRASDGRTWMAERVVVCSGSDLQTLFPTEFADSELKLCKLQMLSVQQSPADQTLPHLASGLTLRHYQSFSACPSLNALKERVARETPELDQYGIHVMASAFPDGRVILGDSHEYGDSLSPFDSELIEKLMLRELRKVVQLEDWNVEQRWHGIYAKHPALPVFERQLDGGVVLFVGTGGAGMTLAFGLAEQAWKRWQEKEAA